VFASLFAIYASVQAVGYRHAYPTAADRIAFARSFAGNIGLRLFYGQPHDVVTVDGYVAWRVGGTLAIAAAVYGLFAAVRAQRAEEDAGRTELVLAGAVGRRTLDLAGLAAIAAGAAVLWLAELAGFAVGGVALGGAAYLALATASVIPVCVGVGAVAGQLAPNRRVALELGGAVVAVLFLFRGVADTTTSVGWLRWATPLGWAEELRPFAGPQPLVLLLPAAATALLLVLAGSISTRRDIGTGFLPARDSAAPDFRLLSSPTLQALRSLQGTLIAWTGALAAWSFIFGVVSASISAADIPASLRQQIAKLGAGSVATPTGFLGFLFVFVVLALSFFVCAQIGAARQEEADQRLETLLAQPVSRIRWLLGRLGLAGVAAAAISVVAGLAAWAGATSAGAHVSFPRLLEAGANAIPTAVFFLGIAALAYATLPRASTAIAYGLVTLAFLWQLVGAVVSAPHWLLDATPFAHVALIPAQAFRAGAAATLVAIGVTTALAAVFAFRRRDLLGA
jgi:ABC-2 type transport system permease protein